MHELTTYMWLNEFVYMFTFTLTYYSWEEGEVCALPFPKLFRDMGSLSLWWLLWADRCSVPGVLPGEDDYCWILWKQWLTEKYVCLPAPWKVTNPE